MDNIQFDPKFNSDLDEAIRSSVAPIMGRIGRLEKFMDQHLRKERANFLIVEEMPTDVNLLPKDRNSLVFSNAEGCFYGYDPVLDIYHKVGSCCTDIEAIDYTQLNCGYTGENKVTQFVLYIELEDLSVAAKLQVTQFVQYIELEFEITSLKVTQFVQYIEIETLAAISSTQFINYIETEPVGMLLDTSFLEYIETEAVGMLLDTSFFEYIETELASQVRATEFIEYIETEFAARENVTRFMLYIETEKI